MIQDQVITIFKNTFSNIIEEVSPLTKPSDIDEWDSLGHITLIQNIETTFNIEFEFDELLNLENVNDIINIVKEKTV